jgi:guanosine-3',5'-bis(diphosphate) 3'-pyrophosphohydrolase
MGEIYIPRYGSRCYPRTWERVPTRLSTSGNRRTFLLKEGNSGGGGHFIDRSGPSSPGGFGGGSGGGSYSIISKRLEIIRNKLLTLSCPKNDIKDVEDAVWYAAQAFEGQFRKSGQHAIEHTIDVIEIMIDHLKIIDRTALVAAALHDVPEDTYVSLSKVKKDYGEDVAFLVGALTKLPKTDDVQQSIRSESNRNKVFTEATKDVRIMAIKLPDRLGNMRTLEGISSVEDRRRIALETLQYYVPLADLLGIWELKRPLEDLSFKHLRPDLYEAVTKFLARDLKERQSMAESLEQSIRALLSENDELGLVRFSIKPRTAYSIYNEILAFGREQKIKGGFEKLSDEFAKVRPLLDLDTFNVIMDNRFDCHKAMGIFQKAFNIPEDGIRDFIDKELKPNFYRSINAEAYVEEFGRVRIKIRTEGMEAVNDRGIVAIVLEQKKKLPSYWEKLIEYWQAGIEEASQSDAVIKTFLKVIVAFTPEGKPIALPSGSTLLDFAFEVHGGLGLAAIDAMMNDEPKTLSTKLADGAVVKIITPKSKPTVPKSGPIVPKREMWSVSLSANNGEARRKIRRYLETRPIEENIEYGKTVVDKLFLAKTGSKLTDQYASNRDFKLIVDESLRRILKKAKRAYADKKTNATMLFSDLNALFWNVGTMSINPKTFSDVFSGVIAEISKK